MDEPQDDDIRPLDPEERANVQADLEDLAAMRLTFENQRVRGVVIACPDCQADHYYEWDLLKENLEHMLRSGEPRMHEPAFEPNEREYVGWDYAKGYVDALSDTGLEPGHLIKVDSCPWCVTSLADEFLFCPRCGRSLGAVRLYSALVERGMGEDEVRAVLVRAGFEPF
jgi:hypothetical protein